MTSYSYDSVGRQTVVAATGAQGIFTYSYDPAGNRLRVSDPSGGFISYSYGAQNRVTVLARSGTGTVTLAYDALSRELRKTAGNGMVTSHVYDPAGRELVLSSATAAGVALSIFTSTYDVIGNRRSVRELDGSRVTYSYDFNYQLTQEQRSGTNAYNTSYTYDGLGNRLIKSDSGQVTTYTYNAANAVLVTQPPTGAPTTSSYDANGNRTVENAAGVLATYTWDGENRMVGAMSVAGGVKTYLYNASGKRVINNSVAGLVTSTWDEENIIVESSSTASLAGQYTDYPGWWGGLTQQHTGGSDQFYVFDPMGNTRYLVDSSNAVVKQYAFKAFGETLVSSGSALAVFAYGGEDGYYQDVSTRLYVRARYLDTAKGRWWSRDPVGFDGGRYNLYRSLKKMAGMSARRSRLAQQRSENTTSLYSYVENNPVKRIDPTGLYSVDLYISKALSDSLDVFHVAVVITEQCGSKILYQGYPHGFAPGGKAPCSHIIKPGCKLWAERQVAPGPVPTIINVASNNNPAAAILNKLNAEVNRINNANFDYIWDDQPLCTSNTVAYDLLKVIGINPPILAMIAPGWANNLWAPGIENPKYYECQWLGRIPPPTFGDE